jgi:hypothetical protein
MHLTRLGNEFRTEFKKSFQQACSEAAIPPPVSKLAPFVQTFCPDLELLPVDGLLDRAAVRPIDMPHAVHPVGTPISHHRREGQRYDRAFWTAFIKPLSENERRILNVGPTIWFQDLPRTEDLTSSQLEIQREFIIAPQPGETVPNKRVQEKIDAWMSQNQITPERFLLPEISATSRSAGTQVRIRQELSAVEICRGFFGLLPVEMKRRFQIPAEVVEYLLLLSK